MYIKPSTLLYFSALEAVYVERRRKQKKAEKGRKEKRQKEKFTRENLTAEA